MSDWSWEGWIRIVRDLLLASLVVLAFWKLLTAEWVIDPNNFPISDLVSLLLAVFAISLSALFYFKATEASNRFYDNTHKFTRDVSEILGRIEAGFGERLRHLDEGYTSLRDHVTRIPFDSGQAEEDIRAEEREVEKIKEERDQLIEKLAERAKLHESERSALFQRLEEMDSELVDSRREIEVLRDRLQASRSEEPEPRSPWTKPERVERFAKRKVLGALRAQLNTPLSEAPSSRVRSAFRKVAHEFHRAFIRDLEDLGLADSGDLTTEGVHFFRHLAEKSEA